MDPAILWSARIAALLISGAVGWRLATTVSTWEEDRFNELENTAGSVLDGSDFLGMYSGCLSGIASTINELRNAFFRGACLTPFLFITAVCVALMGWPPDPAIWTERLGFLLILAAPWLWMPLFAAAVGYFAGRISHAGFFRD